VIHAVLEVILKPLLLRIWPNNFAVAGVDLKSSPFSQSFIILNNINS